MKISLVWRILGVVAVFALFWIGYELGKSNSLSKVSFPSTANADDDLPPAKNRAKGPQLKFETVAATYGNTADLLFERAKVPGGWMVMVSRRAKDGDCTVEGFTFYPDKNLTWDGATAKEKAKADGPRLNAPPRVLAPSYNPKENAALAMELFDADKDGKISGAELDKAPGVKAALDVMNTDSEKGVTKQDIAKRIQSWMDSKVGRMTIACTVLRNGQPLSGATVKFVPEKFLDKIMPEVAVGITSESGMAMISLPTSRGPDGDPPGIHLGMYRVEITKEGEDIPAKYNSETVLGQEASIDNIELQRGIKYDLKY
jgi:hypothetical protein